MSQQLPKYLLMNGKECKYEFVDKTKENTVASVIGCDYIELVQIYPTLSRKKYVLYCDEEGRLKEENGGINGLANPLIPEDVLCYLGGFGCPAGNMVLERDPGDHLSEADLLRAFKEHDKRMIEAEDQEDEFYTGLLKRAIVKYREKRGKITTKEKKIK